MPKSLGQRIRQIRKEKGLTLIEVSEKTGIAQATLSRIETGTMTGTVDSHEKIAATLGIGLGDLYASVDPRLEEIIHVTKDQPRSVTFQSKNVHIELLTSEAAQKKITPLLLTIQPATQTQQEKLERGVEKFLYVLSGELEVQVDKATLEVKTEETLYFDASLPHLLKNLSAKPAKVFVAVSPAKI